MSSRERLNGLDTLRALAILLVLIYHYWVVVSKQDLFGVISTIGWLGVDLFFVLSGYLIGNQVLSPLAKGQAVSFKLFYARRFLRTLPNYYVILILYFIVPSLQGKSTASIWEFLSFTQNQHMRPGETFTHSWSLCIEEWFYLCLPVIVTGCLWLARSVKLFWGSMVVAFVVPIVLRASGWHEHGGAAINGGDYWQFIYYPSMTRFDELLPGVAIAGIQNLHPKMFEWLRQKGNWILGLGLINSAAVIYLTANYFYIEGYGFSGVMASVGYSWIAIAFGLLTLAALSPRTALARLSIPGATSLALWSYAVYLIHKPVYSMLMAPLNSWGLDLNTCTAALIMMAVGAAAGLMLYTLVELPFMNIREKYFSVGNRV